MTITLAYVLKVPPSNTWRLNKNIEQQRGSSQRLWFSEKFTDSSGYKFKIKVATLAFGLSGNRTSEICQVLLVNCKMRKVKVEKFELKITDEEKRSYSADLTDVELKRCGVANSGCGITFDKNLFQTSADVTVRVTVKQTIRVGLRDALHLQLMEELKSPFFTDTILEIGDTELKCHGFMLAARSRVFKSCLTRSGFEESDSRRIKINEDVETVTQMLKYIYTDAFDADDDSIFDLFIAADKYDIQGLKDKCRDILISDLDVSNATDCFRLANIYGSPELLEKSGKMILDHLDEVVETDGWKSLDDQEQDQVLEQVRYAERAVACEAQMKSIKL